LLKLLLIFFLMIQCYQSAAILNNPSCQLTMSHKRRTWSDAIIELALAIPIMNRSHQKKTFDWWLDCDNHTHCRVRTTISDLPYRERAVSYWATRRAPRGETHICGPRWWLWVRRLPRSTTSTRPRHANDGDQLID